jgi:2-polyprenyl-3-methyl-5-hydroxy-6-metoxy-1,4-benzoquinol methylase
MPNINDTYFDGIYKEVWRTMMPDDFSKREVNAIINLLQLNSSHKILDLMCGFGRHSLEFARAGMTVTAVDNLAPYIDQLCEKAASERLPVNAVQQSVLDFKSDEKFDLAICMGNSLNFFNAADTTSILKNTGEQLNPGGHLVINTWSIAEIALKLHTEKSSGIVGDIKMETESHVFFQPARIEAVSTFTSPDGTVEIKKGVDYIFSLNEMEAMLGEAGFTMQDVWSIPGRKKFTIGEPRAYIVARKN